MELYDLLGDGQPQAGSACVGRPGGVQAVKLFKDIGKLTFRDLKPLIGDGIALDKAKRLEELVGEFFDINTMDLELKTADPR